MRAGYEGAKYESQFDGVGPSVNYRGSRLCGEREKSCEHFLADTSQIAERPLNLPAGDLLYYYQLEGIDPFNLFQEGMDPGNENPLSITNRGQLEISVGGWAFEPGKEHKEKTDIQALSYSKERQRYLISVTGEGGGGYKLLINVDTKAGLAHVWMQDRENGKLSDWMLAGRYTNDPDKAQKEEEEEEGDEEDVTDVPVETRPNVETKKAPKSNEEAQSPAVDSGSDYTGFGLVGDGDLAEKHLLLLTKNPTGHRLTAYFGSTPFTGVLASVLVSDDVAKAIAAGDMQSLEGASGSDKESGDRLDFKVAGRDFTGAPRVTVTATTRDRVTKITHCFTYRPAKISIY